MLIACPNCTTSYRIETSALGADGRSVRCARCRSVWFATAAVEDLVTQGAGLELLPAAAAETAPPALPEREIDWPLLNEDKPAPAEPIEGEIHPPEPVSEPEVTDDSPALVPAVMPAVDVLAPDLPAPDLPALNAGPPENIEAIAARRVRRSPARRSGPRKGRLLAVLMLLFASFIGAVFFWRVEVVRFAPQTASLFRILGMPINLRGLVFENVKTRREVQDGVMVLVVEGSIANASKQTADIPRLRFALRNASGLEIYAWTSMVEKTHLDPAETFPFRTRLASPPAEGRDVVVRFFTRQDAGAGR